MAATATKEIVTVEGCEIAVSNPDKLLWPEQNISKMLYLQKLAALFPYLLPYCHNRYLTTIRFPNGIHDKSFYQKNCPEPIPEFVHTEELNGIRYVNLDSLPTLIWLGNLACLEFHPSLHHIGNPLPAEWLIDIDPSREPEPRLMQAVLLVGEALDKMGIRSIPKTSGATGVQIYIPIRPGYTFEQLRKIGHFLGTYLSRQHPRLFTIERLKKNRGDLIYIDYLQHWHGKTLSAPYTPRAKAAASVSTPLEWKEVELNADSRDFNLWSIEQRLIQKGDLIRNVERQNLDHVLSFIK